MKKLNVTPISDSAQMPLKKGTLQFLQDANLEVVAATMKALVGVSYNPATVYVMFGCANTGTDPNYIISAGAVFYQGEIFLVDATSFSTSGNVAIFQIITTQYTTYADPVTFSDATVHNVHDIRKVQVLAGTSGSGIADFSQRFVLDFTIPPKLNATGAGGVQVLGTYPDLIFSAPSLVHAILHSGSLNIGNVPSPGNTFTITFASVGTGNYYVQGTIISQGVDIESDSSITWSIKNRTDTSFDVYVRELGAATQNIAFEYIMFAK